MHKYRVIINYKRLRCESQEDCDNEEHLFGKTYIFARSRFDCMNRIIEKYFNAPIYKVAQIEPIFVRKGEWEFWVYESNTIEYHIVMKQIY